MSWLDDLISQISQNSSGDAADVVPSEAATSSEFNQARDSQSANDLFNAVYDGGNPPVSDAAPAQYQQSQPDPASAADYRNGADVNSDAHPGFGGGTGNSGSIIQSLAKRMGLRNDASGNIDYSDPKTMDALVKLILGGGALLGSLTHQNSPVGYKTAAQLQAEIKNPLSSWTPSQQASANSFFNGTINNGPSRARLYAADMVNPIVPGKGYADGGSVTDQQIQDWLTAHPGATDSQIADAMNQYGVTTQQMAGATGDSLSDIQSRYDAATSPTSTSNLSPEQVAAAQQYIQSQYGGGYDASGKWDPSLNPAFVNGVYQNTSNDNLNFDLLGAGIANGYTLGNESQILGIPTGTISNYINNYESQFNSVPGSQGVFLDDGANLYNAMQNPQSSGFDATSYKTPTGYTQDPTTGAWTVTFNGGGSQTLGGADAYNTLHSQYGDAGTYTGGQPGTSQFYDLAGLGYLTPAQQANYHDLFMNSLNGSVNDATGASMPTNLPVSSVVPSGATSGGTTSGGTSGGGATSSGGGGTTSGGSYHPPGWTSSAYTPTSAITQYSSSSPSAAAYGHAKGGAIQGQAGMPHGPLGHVMADTGGQDDTVNARLAGGEYVMDADTVSAAGDGNNAAGAKKFDEFRENLRRHKRSAPPNKIPPRARELSSYMKGGR